MMNKNLQEILRCPLTKNQLKEISYSQIQELNSRIDRGELLHLDGTLVKRKIEAGFVSLDNQFAYLVEDDIVILLKSLAIVLNENSSYKGCESCLREEKKIVRDFYDQVGWKKGEGGLFCDTLRFVDSRPVVKDYYSKCSLRVKRYIKHQGKYLLDVASGPIVNPEYVTYSSEFDFRICVDISLLALKEARKRIGKKGIYLLADITNLPIQENVVDAVVSLHTIYHVPENEQKKAFQEIFRVLKPEATGVIVYVWKNNLLVEKLKKLFGKRLGKIHNLVKIILLTRRKKMRAYSSQSTYEPNLYFHAHDYHWFVRELGEMNVRILVYRTLSASFMKKYIHQELLGKQILALIYWLEDRFPELAGRLGQYPMFVIKK